MPDGTDSGQTVGVSRRPVDATGTARANRRWWDTDADAYQAAHGQFLGDADFVWSPERLREADAHLLGDVTGKRILEVGCGSAMCSRWLAAQRRAAGRVRPVRPACCGTPGEAPSAPGSTCRLVQADAQHLPFATDSFDIAFTAFGAVPFVADSAAVMREVARVLRAGGRWVFATTHPTRWSFPDDPGPDGLTATMPYLDRTPYVEYGEDGRLTYVEHHRTLGDRVREITAAGFHAGRSRRAGVAGGPDRGLGSVVAAARRDPARHRDLRVRTALISRRGELCARIAGKTLPTWLGRWVSARPRARCARRPTETSSGTSSW